MTDKTEPTVEEAREIVAKADAPTGLADRTDTSSGIVMKANPVDKSILTYDPADVDYDDAVRKQAEKDRKAEDAKKG